MRGWGEGGRQRGAARKIRFLIPPILLACTAPAGADELPPLHPTRDVAVVYDVEANPAGGHEAKQTLRMFWGQGGSLLRVEIGGQSTIALVNFVSRQIQVLIGRQRVVLDAPFDQRFIPGFALPAGATAQRIGTATVAGAACTQFRLKSASGDGEMCVTPDGLVLSAQGSTRQGSGTLQAVAVKYGPQPVSLFSVPAGYRRMDLVPSRR